MISLPHNSCLHEPQYQVKLRRIDTQALREPEEFTLNLKIDLLRQWLWDFPDDAVLFHKIEYMPVKD